MNILKIGSAVVTCIEEIDIPATRLDDLMRPYDAELFQAKAGLLPVGYISAETGDFVVKVHNWLVQIDGRTILIDTGFGNHKERPGLPMAGGLRSTFLEKLAAAGVSPRDVDLVLCTHLHIDHVGWNTRWDDGRWVPTFPNASYVFSEIDRQYWDPRNPAYAPTDAGRYVAQGVFEDSVQPILDAGLVRTVAPDATIDEAFSLIPAPGHTPGHVAIKLSSDGERMIFCGDVLHHPVQVLIPHWNSVFCEDPIVAVQTRRRILAMCADENLILAPAHLTRSACQIFRAGDGFRAMNIPW